MTSDLRPARPLRILHAPRNPANQAGYVAAALRRLGHEVEVWDLRPTYNFPVDRAIPPTSDPGVPWDLLREAVERFDVVHFHMGRSLVPAGSPVWPPYWDLPVYRALGRRLFFTFHGTDARIRRIHETINPWSHYRLADVPADDDRTEKSLQLIRTYADRVFVASVNLLHFLPQAEYLPRAIDLAAWPEQPLRQRDRPVIAHAPSNRELKGTDQILATLDALDADGVPFELRLLEGVPNSEVRTAMADADIVVDNVIAGSYGLVSMEAMAIGRVAVANLSDDVRSAHPDCPVVHADPATLGAVLRDLVLDVDARRRLAAAGRPYVARVHDADAIAARLVEAYTAPPAPVPRRSMPDWMSFEPQRRIEQLDERVGRLETELARAALREARLRARLGIAPGVDVEPHARLRALARRVLPARLRSRLRRRARP